MKRAVDFFWSDQSRSVEVSTGRDKSRRLNAWGRGGQYSVISIGFYDLCLSPLVAKGWTQKEINPFVSKTTESACICIIIAVIDIINIDREREGGEKMDRETEKERRYMKINECNTIGLYQ